MSATTLPGIFFVISYPIMLVDPIKPVSPSKSGRLFNTVICFYFEDIETSKAQCLSNSHNVELTGRFSRFFLDYSIY